MTNLGREMGFYRRDLSFRRFEIFQNFKNIVEYKVVYKQEWVTRDTNVFIRRNPWKSEYAERKTFLIGISLLNSNS